MKKSSIWVVTAAIVFSFSFAGAAEKTLMIVVCGAIDVTTNSARPNEIGAAVITKSLKTSQNVFKLVGNDEQSSRLISGLKKGNKVKISGAIRGSQSNKPISNADGSIDLVPGLVVPGC